MNALIPSRPAALSHVTVRAFSGDAVERGADAQRERVGGWLPPAAVFPGHLADIAAGKL